MADDQERYCAECGGAEGVIQHVDIAWPPMKRRRFVNDWDLTAPEHELPGRHVALWLHPECEAEALERLEKQFKPAAWRHQIRK